ncbi:hypothetical protein JTB14_021071 [Gonioctena quinquepunctata]|nr:hypothetical protein JTB14_021071 [Gonioctena quinquepunctata]
MDAVTAFLQGDLARGIYRLRPEVNDQTNRVCVWREARMLGFSGQKDEVTNLLGHSDSDWASDVDGGRSVTGYVFTKNGSAEPWSMEKQPTVALGTTEAKYLARSSAQSPLVTTFVSSISERPTERNKIRTYDDENLGMDNLQMNSSLRLLDFMVPGQNIQISGQGMILLGFMNNYVG